MPYTTLAPGGTLDLAPRVSVTRHEGVCRSQRRDDAVRARARAREPVELAAGEARSRHRSREAVGHHRRQHPAGGRPAGRVRHVAVAGLRAGRGAHARSVTRCPSCPGLADRRASAHVHDAGAKGDAVVQHELFARQGAPDRAIRWSVGRRAEAEAARTTSRRSSRRSSPGTASRSAIVRGGKPLTVRAEGRRGQRDADHRRRTSGSRYKVPLHINIDTSDISGPSAGLAITLAIIDALTPGELTGGKRVAVTGTIDPRATSARSAACRRRRWRPATPARRSSSCRAAATTGCRKDVATARKRVGKDVEVAPVSTLAQALKVLRDAGGARRAHAGRSLIATRRSHRRADREFPACSADCARFLQYDVARAEMSRRIPGLADD